MRWGGYHIELRDHHKIIVGEGESDRNFFAAFCRANSIAGFTFAFTGMHVPPPYTPSGFGAFIKYLPVLETLAGFPDLTDVILVCDAGEDAAKKLRDLQGQIRGANRKIGRVVFTENPDANAITTTGIPRVHVLMIPHNSTGGVETLCVDVARDHRNDSGENGTEIEGWVDIFANNACTGWTREKRDKLRLQAFLSAAWDGKPDVHFSQLFDLTRDRVVPLVGRAFDPVRDFLRNVEKL